MAQLSDADFDVLLHRGGLQLTPEEKGWVKPVWEGFIEPLAALHEYAVEGEESGRGFLPHDRLIEEVQG